jgi:parvulin-like peptidyl-prolyl isomerase
MPLTVNGELLPPQFVDLEASRLASHPDFLKIEDEAERLKRLRLAAEEAAVNRMLIAQAAARDPRPVSESDIQRECQAFQARNGGHGAYEAHVLRSQVEARLRVKRAVEEIRKQALAPAEEAIRETYERYKDTFQSPERVRAAHIVKHTGEGLDEAEAKLGIEQAQAELERGTEFAAVAEQFSDCKGKGGDIGWFARGAMVQEFENIIFALNPGERSGIFQTSMGYHIASLLDRRPAGSMDYEDARLQVKATLTAWHEHEALRLETMRLREAAEIRDVQS